MLRAPLPLLSVLLAAGLIAGCSSTNEDKTANWSPDRIYSEAREEMTGGAYDKAVPLLEKLEGRAAGTPLAHHEIHWSYDGEGAPANWGTLKPEWQLCNAGERQSPIDIRRTLLADLPPIPPSFDEPADCSAAIALPGQEDSP